ncbi:amino acid ABC transporter permease [Desulfogranum mediterraneum]|uniref:amino acid ABC transporter permease n=1 Tax=Desulfogranum mediterraneum TaxID=160661 RepID=UPI0004280F1D|nr:amino acid ABC transporter permease [Desulfogranum mediterraneum]
MSLYPGLDAPKPPIYKRLWALFFVVFVVLSIGGTYYATKSVDYIWRWYTVPQYFFYLDDVEVLAEAEGIVASIEPAGEESAVVIRGADGEQRYLVPADGLRVDLDQFVYVDDVLGSSQQWKSGLLIYGLWITLKVSLIASVFALIIGVATGMARISNNPALRWLAITYIELVRGSPLLVQMMIWYFVIGALINKSIAGWGLGPVPTIWFGVLSLALFTGAYTAEIVRAGIQSVHLGQMEAARSLGMSYGEAMRKIILPQAIRRILPALAGQFISLIKDSSLLGVISIRELTKITREVVTTSLQPFEFWIVCALLYLILTFGLSLLVQHLERRAI